MTILSYPVISRIVRVETRRNPFHVLLLSNLLRKALFFVAYLMVFQTGRRPWRQLGVGGGVDGVGVVDGGLRRTPHLPADLTEQSEVVGDRAELGRASGQVVALGRGAAVGQLVAGDLLADLEVLPVTARPCAGQVVVEGIAIGRNFLGRISDVEYFTGSNLESRFFF